MTNPLKLDTFEDIGDLPRTPASDVKKLGWRGVMRTARLKGKVVVTHHNEPEAVILTAETYGALVQALRQVESKTESALEMLRDRFDRRLAVLTQSDANDRLRSVMREPTRLGGKVKAGSGH